MGTGTGLAATFLISSTVIWPTARRSRSGLPGFSMSLLTMEIPPTKPRLLIRVTEVLGRLNILGDPRPSSGSHSSSTIARITVSLSASNTCLAGYFLSGGDSEFIDPIAQQSNYRGEDRQYETLRRAHPWLALSDGHQMTCLESSHPPISMRSRSPHQSLGRY